MPISLDTYEDVHLHVTCLLFDKESPYDCGILRVAPNMFASIFISSELHIMVDVYATRHEAEECDGDPIGGGICILWDDEKYHDFEEDPNSCDNIRERNDPEEIAQLVNDKALFVWELIHSA